jgi:hypothetical protein
MRRLAFSLPLLALILVACSDNANSSDGGQGGAGASTATGTGSTGTESTSTGKPPGAVEWKGTIASWKFDDGTNDVDIILDGEDGASGKVIFGKRALAAAPSDPSVGYPVGFEGLGYANAPPLPLTGFAYTMKDIIYTSTRLRFDFRSSEIWDAWCPIETPVQDAQDPSKYECVQLGVGNSLVYPMIARSTRAASSPWSTAASSISASSSVVARPSRAARRVSATRPT